LNKADFVAIYATKTEQSKKSASMQVDYFLETLRESLASEKCVKFIGDFSLEIIPTEARKGRNPSNGEEMIIPAGNRVKFKMGTLLKSAITE